LAAHSHVVDTSPQGAALTSTMVLRLLKE